MVARWEFYLMVLRRLVCFWLSLDVLERPEKKEEGTWLTSNYSDSDYIVEDKNKDYIKWYGF